VFVLNFDGSIGSIEEVFSLAKSSDKWYLEYGWKKNKCYVWKINGKDNTSCYNQIN
jgi:hypothetical protein